MEGEVTGDQIQTFIKLLIYTGLRISDASTFGPDMLQGNNAFLLCTRPMSRSLRGYPMNSSIG